MSIHPFQLAFNVLIKRSYTYLEQFLSTEKKWHQYLWQDLNDQFVLEAAPDQSTFYMTTQKNDVAPGDYIEISGLGSPSHYQIVQIERYCDPPDMWMATLRKLTQNHGLRRNWNAC